MKIDMAQVKEFEEWMKEEEERMKHYNVDIIVRAKEQPKKQVQLKLF